MFTITSAFPVGVGTSFSDSLGLARVSVKRIAFLLSLGAAHSVIMSTCGGQHLATAAGG